ncbi:hypothetical protein Q5H89_17740 [Hymenobacter sp. CA2-7]|nr:hypothetical protein [Hymenobacter sp. CA2-7]MDO7887218.1 hypothetical protein [Hymenobacter sp. CA2-7]
MPALPARPEPGQHFNGRHGGFVKVSIHALLNPYIPYLTLLVHGKADEDCALYAVAQRLGRIPACPLNGGYHCFLVCILTIRFRQLWHLLRFGINLSLGQGIARRSLGLGSVVEA